MFLRDERHGRHTGHRARTKATGIARRPDGQEAPGSATLEGGIVAARVRTPSHRPRSIVVGIGLVAAGRVLRNPRFAELVIVGSVVLVALTQLGWKVLVRAVTGLIAWDNARLADLERQLRRPRMAQALPGAVLEGTVMPPPLPGVSSRQRHAVVLGVGLVAAGRVLCRRRFEMQVTVAILALQALRQMAWKEVVRGVRDLIAWDNARLADWEKEVQRQHKAARTQLCHE